VEAEICWSIHEIDAVLALAAGAAAFGATTKDEMAKL
jgi:hypothetical protein